MLRAVRRGAVLLALPLALAACGSSTKHTSTAPPPQGSAGSGAAGSAGASGSTITLDSAAPITSPVFQIPQYKAAMLAAIDSLNAQGGVAGHRLALNFCDTGYTANGEIACARKIAAHHASVVVGPDLFVDGSGAAWKTLQAAKIPVIGSLGGEPSELNSSNVFPMGSGVPGAFTGAAAAIVKAGAKKISIVIDTNPSGQFAAQLITGALKRAGITPLGTTTADSTSDPTYATAAAKATSAHPDGAILVGAPSEVTKMVTSLRSGGYTGKIATASILLPQQSIDQLKGAADGVILDSILAFPSDTANSGVARFLADMHKYQASAVADDNALTGWTAVELFAKAAAGAKSYDAAGFTAAFTSLSNPVDVGSIAPWSVVGRTSPYPGFSRIVNPGITFGVVSHGKVIPDGKGFVDPLTVLGK